jgi:TolB-like protein
VSFLAELRRRNVIRMAGLYLVAAWLATQVAGTLLPMFDAPAWIARAVVIALAIGFVPALVFAWVFELTPQGLKREADVPAAGSIAPRMARRMDRAIIVVLLLALGYFAFDKFVLAPRREAAIATQAKQAGEAVAAKSARQVPDNSIAVLPLANDSGDKDQQYFSDGLSDDLINALMQFGNLKVIGRNSAFQFRDSKESSAAIGLKLGVAYLLTGSVRKLGETVRVNAQLVKAADGSGVWSQSYDRPYKDLFKLQDEITQAVAEALKAKLLGTGNAVVQTDHPPSGNLDAYSAYQQGRFYAVRSNQPDLRIAIAHYRDAVRLDPAYATAYAALGAAQLTLAGNYLGSADAAAMYAQVQSAIDTALRLNPALPEAYVTQARLMINRDFDWNGGLANTERAQKLAPNDPRVLVAYARNLAMKGQTRVAIGIIEQALKLDPLRADVYQTMAYSLAANGRLDEAKAAIDKAVELQPGSDTFRVLQVFIEVLRGDSRTALAIAKTIPAGLWRDEGMAVALQIGPDRDAADAALQNMIRKHADAAAYQIADIYALRHDPDNTFAWLDRAWASRDPGLIFLLFDPFILRYKADPRFAAFARKIGLPTTTDAKGLP